MITEFPGRLRVPVDETRDHIRGPLDAPLTLVEYGDFECPHCSAAYPQVEAVRQQMGNSLRFVYRHFPLENVHPHAVNAAQAAEAAGAQGQFWEMHDQLFEHQDALDDESLLFHAAVLGLDERLFALDLTNGTHLPRVNEDFLSGVHSGVRGTPTFFINNVRHEGAWDAASLLAALVEARGTRARGAAR